MNYIPDIDEDAGFCPQCSSSDTVTLGSKLKRVCLSCEFSEEFESHAQLLLAWQVKRKASQSSSAIRAGTPDKASNPPASQAPKSDVREIEKIIDAIEPGVTRVTVPTRYREEFDDFLKTRKVEQAHPYKTDVWNNIESAYTSFELLAKRPIAEAIFDEWAAS